MASLRDHRRRADCRSKIASLAIVYCNVDELKLDPRNPRLHSKKQVKLIAESIKAFGFNTPCLVDEQLRVVSGHGRVAAARLLGIRQVPAVSLAHLDELQIRAFQIADNRLTENSTWDKCLLAEQFQNLRNVNLDFNLESTGFDLGEIDLLIDGFELQSRKNEKSSEESPSTESEIPITRRGDMWLLGNHRIVCGDAWDEQSYSVVMNSRHAAGVFTHLSHGGIEDAELLLKLFSHLAEHSDPAAFQFVAADHLLIKSLIPAAERAGLELVDVCVAVKEGAGPGSLYRSQHDLIFVFENGKTERSRKPQFERTNVWHYRPSSRRRTSEQMKDAVPQNELPLSLVADAITDSTGPGGIVLDPFLGNGTTLIAAEQRGRICHGLESDPLQVDRAVRRWQQVTGMSAAHAERRLSFDHMAEDGYGKA
jgi:hypothetical protein